MTDTQTEQSAEDIWHCKFGHLGSRNLGTLVIVLPTTHQEISLSANHVLMVKSVKAISNYWREEKQTSCLSLFTVMFVAKFRCHL